ncbi:hypothetical protein ABVT39_006271 [Epinephelus coioides]
MNVTDVFKGFANISNNGNFSGNGSMGLFHTSPVINALGNIFSIVILFIAMISLGCTMEISKIKFHLLRPKGVAIALLAQFGLMPLTAFSLAKMLQMEPLKAVTVLICGCSPGGNLSNIFSLTLKGDMNLSQGFPGLENAVPYAGIIFALVFSLVPCGIGIAINHYKPKYSSIIKSAGLSIMGVICIIGTILYSVTFKDMLWMVLTPDFLVVVTLMPMIGFTLGYGMSVLCRLNPQCSRTVSMETGCQNIQLCVAILKVAFPPEIIGPMFFFPLLYCTFQCVEAILLALCFKCYQVFKPPTDDGVDFKNGTEEEITAMK